MIHKGPEKISFPELQNTFRRVLRGDSPDNSVLLMFDKIKDSLYSNPFSEYLTESSFYISYSVTPCLKIAIS